MVLITSLLNFLCTSSSFTLRTLCHGRQRAEFNGHLWGLNPYDVRNRRRIRVFFQSLLKGASIFSIPMRDFACIIRLKKSWTSSKLFSQLFFIFRYAPIFLAVPRLFPTWPSRVWVLHQQSQLLHFQKVIVFSELGKQKFLTK